jgi:malonate-semialdehyde dehydrogenase (acetylating)/methylmalonate-semialdehyde dehydrogenase
MAVHTSVEKLKNFVGGEWIDADAASTQEVRNPATGQVIAEVPMGGQADVDRAVASAKEAYQSWRRVPPVQRARYLFQLKFLLEERAEDLARICTMENGKTLPESRGSVRRGIECVEVAAGAPSLLMGMAIEDPASRRSTSPRWCRSGSTRSPWPAETLSCANRPSRCRCPSASSSS